MYVLYVACGGIISHMMLYSMLKVLALSLLISEDKNNLIQGRSAEARLKLGEELCCSSKNVVMFIKLNCDCEYEFE